MRNGAKYFRPDTRDPRKLVETNLNHCLAPRCRGLVQKKICHSPYCSKCRGRRWATKFPLNYAFHNLRKRAKQRGKDFSLTRSEYIEFAIKTDYARLKGKTSLSLSINRIDNLKGYHVGNIEAITLSENSRKQFVPYFANQQENIAYKPTDEELAAVASQINK
jgi:hypothetical protein